MVDVYVPATAVMSSLQLLSC